MIILRRSDRLRNKEHDLRDYAENAPDAPQEGDLGILDTDLRYEISEDDTFIAPSSEMDPIFQDVEEWYPMDDNDLRIEIDELDALRGEAEEPVRRPPSESSQDTETEAAQDVDYDPVDFTDPQVDLLQRSDNALLMHFSFSLFRSTVRPGSWPQPSPPARASTLSSSLRLWGTPKACSTSGPTSRGRRLAPSSLLSSP